MCTVPWTTVPEAAIDKNRNPFLWKGEVRSARQTKLPAPAFDARISEQARELFLRGLVAATANPRHDLRSGKRHTEVIAHEAAS